MKQAKMQICLFIVLLAGLTGCGINCQKGGGDELSGAECQL